MDVDATEAVAERKIRDALTPDGAIATLTPEERGRVLARPSLLRLLAKVRERAERRAAAATHGVSSWWGNALSDAGPEDVRDFG